MCKVCSLLILLTVFAGSTAAVAQTILPFSAPSVVVVTSLESETALSTIASSFVREGYALDFGSMSDVEVSTNPREVIVADDLEYKVQVKHTITLQPGKALATVHIKTTWAYGGLNKPVDANPSALAEYKRTYIPVYSNRIRLYIDSFVSEFDFAMLTHPLNEKP